MFMHLPHHVICIILFGAFEHCSLGRVKSNLKRFHPTYFRKLKPAVFASVNSVLLQLGEFSWCLSELLKYDGSFINGVSVIYVQNRNKENVYYEIL